MSKERGGAPLEIAVYDLAGRRVATVEDGPAKAGDHKVSWGLRDETGSPVRSGLYVRFKLAGAELKRSVIAVQ